MFSSCSLTIWLLLASLYDDQYDVKAGHWPKNKNECVLVLSKKGGISDFMLYTLGLRDPAQLDQMLKAFSEEKSVKVTTGKQGYRYKDLLGITFKVVNASSYYNMMIHIRYIKIKVMIQTISIHLYKMAVI